MKRILSLLALALCLALLVSCGSSGGVQNRAGEKKLSGVERLLEEAEKQAAETAGTEPEIVVQTNPPEDPETVRAYLEGLRAMAPVSWDAKVDVDLASMSGTVVYSQVNDMMMSPKNYLGKTVKMRGTMSVMEGETRNYYACVIQDATACCASGIEFVPVAAFAYPEDFPESGTEVTVIGIFDLYTEQGSSYCQLIAAQMK